MHTYVSMSLILGWYSLLLSFNHISSLIITLNWFILCIPFFFYKISLMSLFSFLLSSHQNTKQKKNKKNWPTKQLTHLIYDVFEYMLQYHGLSCSSCVSTIWGVVYFIHSLLQFSTLNFLLHKLFTTLSP